MVNPKITKNLHNTEPNEIKIHHKCRNNINNCSIKIHILGKHTYQIRTWI